MNLPQWSRWLGPVLPVILGAATVPLLAQPVPERYEPQVGQPGRDAVWVPSPEATVEAMLDLAGVTAEDFVVDLGSGDGRMVIAAAKRGARALGVEYNPDLVRLSSQLAVQQGVDHLASFVEGDMYEADFSEATVLALFLLPENLERLSPKFLKLPPGTRIVVNSFGIPGWEADLRQDTAGCDSFCHVMLYYVPARVQGEWRLADSTLALEQQIQAVSGTMVSDGRTTMVEGRVTGPEIQLTIGEAEYQARIAGDRMEGTALVNGRTRAFTAARVRAPADAFLERIAAHCGQAFAGRIVANEPQMEDDPFAGRRLVMHVRECREGELKIPFHVGDDRSRTWVLTRTAAGLRLKHDHRHEDGSEDRLTMYGGDTAAPGSEVRQEFPVDAESIELFEREGLTASVTNVWAMEIEPGRRFLYELARPGRLFRVEFDLTAPVDAPPAPWGHARRVP